MSCKEISADWAAQRIKGLSLWYGRPATRSSPKKTADGRTRAQVIKTLIDTFRYPRRGPGMMWEACAEKFRAWAAELAMGMKVVGLSSTIRKLAGLWTVDVPGRPSANRHSIEAQARHLVRAAAAAGQRPGASSFGEGCPVGQLGALCYRDFLTVVLILKDRQVFPRQLDLHSRSERQGWADSELQVLVAGNGARSEHDLLRPGILLLRGRRPVERHGRSS